MSADGKEPEPNVADSTNHPPSPSIAVVSAPIWRRWLVGFGICFFAFLFYSLFIAIDRIQMELAHPWIIVAWIAMAVLALLGLMLVPIVMFEIGLYLYRTWTPTHVGIMEPD